MSWESSVSGASVVAEVTRVGMVPRELAVGTVYLVADGDGHQRVVDTDDYGWTPRRTVRSVVVEDVPSLLGYLTLHGDADRPPEVWANRAEGEVLGVLDPPLGDEPAWCSHTVVLRLKPTPEWGEWVAASGKLMSQDEFAELVEDRVADIVDPTGAEMLELAQSFHATSKVAFESSSFLADGRRGLEFRETVDAKAGRTGQIQVPAVFHLALRPWEGVTAFKVTARLRYRIESGRLRIGYKLVDPDGILRVAFDDVVDDVREGLPEGWRPQIRRGWPQ